VFALCFNRAIKGMCCHQQHIPFSLKPEPCSSIPLVSNLAGTPTDPIIEHSHVSVKMKMKIVFI
jgi:hypothetical protein